jgi:putative N6-adenine-specific DNA methylase
LDFVAYNGDELYNNVIKGHDFTKYILPSQSFMIDATVKECAIHDQRFLAMRLKDAIVDQFREKCGGVRPDIDTDRPDLKVYIKGYKNQYSIAIDTSGAGLYKREYRDETGLAPMKENLAAALIRMTGWDKTIPIVDLTCGSGTILIEAAMMALNIAPGSFRRHFGFQTLQGFDDVKWKKVIDETMKKELNELPFKFYGYDIDRKVLSMAKSNAANAGVDHLIEFKSESVATVEPPCEKGIVILNPPYGTRVGDEDNLRDIYRDLGYTLKTKFSGWDCYILSGNKDLIVDLKLKASRKFFVYNGSLECRFLKYTIK